MWYEKRYFIGNKWKEKISAFTRFSLYVNMMFLIKIKKSATFYQAVMKYKEN